MKINRIDNISYKAKFLNKECVGKLTEGSVPRYINHQVSFVKIEPHNSDDIKALEEASKYWEYGYFTTNVYHAACALRNGSEFYKDHKIYALTSQNSDFQKLDSSKLLGLMDIGPSPNQDDSTFIEHLQVNPKYLFSKPLEYKGIGTGILNSIKLYTDKISCYPSSPQYVSRFYSKNGFKKHHTIFNLYIWQK